MIVFIAMLNLAQAADAVVPTVTAADTAVQGSLRGWATVGLNEVITPDGAVQPAASLDLSRIQGRLSSGRYSSMAQLDFSGGLPTLIDAFAQVGKERWLRAGRFKTPLSQQFLVGATHLLVPSRPSFVGVAPRRELGVATGGTWAAGHALQGGAYRQGAIDGAGTLLLVEALDLALLEGLKLHLAHAPTIALDGSNQVSQTVDIGLTVDASDNVLQVEALGRQDTLGTSAGGSALVAHRFDGPHWAWQPALEWDSLWSDEVLDTRLSAAVNLRSSDHDLLQRLSYETQLGDTMNHTVRFQVQVGLSTL